MEGQDAEEFDSIRKHVRVHSAEEAMSVGVNRKDILIESFSIEEPPLSSS